MRQDICTIPISEVFEVNDGCPICRMRETVEKHLIYYIMGAAMMEPDVRIETNRLGFCERHFDMMLANRGRLQLALVLESHIAEINKNIFGNHGFKIPLSNDDNHGSSIYYAQHSSFLKKLNELRADNYTIVVATKEELNSLETTSDKEILTISDIKGLEREIIIMYNVLTNHYSKLPDIVNTKNADSNSLKRYYFNLFYVGITRAQNHIVVIEEKDIPDFKEFFEGNFEKLDENVDVSELPFELTVLGDDEYIYRITEALHIRKFDIVTKYIDKINDVE